MRISDWSSDVCSSDLVTTIHDGLHQRTCPLCEGMCGVTVAVDDGRVTTVRPNRDDAWSRGHICPKGTPLGALHHDPDRLRTPMVRDGDTWKSASYEAAFERLAMLVEGVRDRHGPHAFARSEEHTSELQSLMHITYAVF